MNYAFNYPIIIQEIFLETGISVGLLKSAEDFNETLWPEVFIMIEEKQLKYFHNY